MFRVGANVGLADSLIVTENQDDDWCLQLDSMLTIMVVTLSTQLHGIISRVYE